MLRLVFLIIILGLVACYNQRESINEIEDAPYFPLLLQSPIFRNGICENEEIEQRKRSILIRYVDTINLLADNSLKYNSSFLSYGDTLLYRKSFSAPAVNIEKLARDIRIFYNGEVVVRTGIPYKSRSQGNLWINARSFACIGNNCFCGFDFLLPYEGANCYFYLHKKDGKLSLYDTVCNP